MSPEDSKTNKEERLEAIRHSASHVMAEAVLNKFTQNYDLKLLLINTTPHYLVEGNTWCDNYWGNCSCGYCTNIEGQNKLGITLMAVRNILTK